MNDKKRLRDFIAQIDDIESALIHLREEVKSAFGDRRFVKKEGIIDELDRAVRVVNDLAPVFGVCVTEYTQEELSEHK